MKLQSENPALFDQYVPDSVRPTAEGCAKVITPVIFDAVGIVTKEPIPFATK
jgi:hypothetical protein